MASYVTKYFNDLYLHAAEIVKVCADALRLAYVIGNSKFYGHPLPSDEILAAFLATSASGSSGSTGCAAGRARQGFTRRWSSCGAPVNSGLACNPPSQMLL